MRLKSLLFVLLYVFFFYAKAQYISRKTCSLMGSRFDFILVVSDSLTGEKYMNILYQEIERIENSISEWKPNSTVSKINQMSGIEPVKVDKELFELTKNALYFSKITDGAFDISTVAMDKIWKFDGSMEKMPSQIDIANSIKNVDYKNIILDSINQTIFLSKPGMKIGFGATGKGYAADKGRDLMQKLGIKAGIVNASGDLSSWGFQPNGKPWIIGITNPFKPEKILKKLKLTEASITTSGDYEKYVFFDGKRYSHIINPKTGYPSNGITSVSVTGKSAQIANGLSTSIMVLGVEKAQKLMTNFPEYNYLIITDDNKKIHSKNFK